MASLEDFAASLSSSERDELVFTAQEMMQGLAKLRLDEIEEEISDVVAKINVVNQKREALTSEKMRLENLLRLLDKFLTGQEPDLELKLLQMELSNRLDFLRVKIAETRPNGELKIKHQLVRERQMLEEGRQIGDEIMMRLFPDGP
jgi:hypothetical protein